MLDQQPFPSRILSKPFSPHPNKHETSLEPPAAQLEFQLAALDLHLRGELPFHLEGTLIPNRDLPRPVVARRDHPLEGAVLKRVVLGLHRQPPVARVEGWPFRHSPGLQHAIYFQPEVIM